MFIFISMRSMINTSRHFEGAKKPQCNNQTLLDVTDVTILEPTIVHGSPNYSLW